MYKTYNDDHDKISEKKQGNHWRERRHDATDPYELARHIINVNSLEDLFAHAKESYRITLHIPGPLWTKYRESHVGTRQVVKNALIQYYHCFYVDDSIDDEHFELHYDRV